MSGGAELPPSVVKDGEKDKRGTFLTKKAIGIIVFLGIVLFFVVLIGINQHPHLATSGNGSSGNQPPPENSQVAASRVMSQFPSGRDLPMESPQVGKTIPKFQPLFKNAPIENSGGSQLPGPSSSSNGRAAYFQAPPESAARRRRPSAFLSFRSQPQLRASVGVHQSRRRAKGSESGLKYRRVFRRRRA